MSVRTGLDPHNIRNILWLSAHSPFIEALAIRSICMTLASACHQEVVVEEALIRGRWMWQSVFQQSARLDIFLVTDFDPLIRGQSLKRTVQPQTRKASASTALKRKLASPECGG